MAVQGLQIVRFVLLAIPALAPAAGAQGIQLYASLSGAEVVPPTASSACGSASLELDPIGLQLSAQVETTAQDAVAVRVCRGAEGESGPSLLELTGGAGSWAGTSAALAPEVVSELLRDGGYVEVLTPAHPAGELRGQVIFPRNWAAGLTQAGVVPPSGSLAHALAEGRLDMPAGTLSLEVDAGSVATAVRLHAGGLGTVGPVLLELSGGPELWTGTTSPLDDLELFLLQFLGLYVQIDSAAYPAGELRGPVELGTFFGDTERLSLQSACTQTLRLRTHPACAGQLYLALGSASGSSPGLPLDVTHLALNPDAWTSFTLANPNTAILQDSFGFLDGAGAGEMRVALPPGLSASLAGVTLHHAFVVYNLEKGLFELGSNAVPLELVP